MLTKQTIYQATEKHQLKVFIVTISLFMALCGFSHTYVKLHEPAYTKEQVKAMDKIIADSGVIYRPDTQGGEVTVWRSGHE